MVKSHLGGALCIYVFHIGGRVRAVIPMVPLSLLHFSNGPIVLLQDVFKIGDRVRSVILSLGEDWSRLSLSTGELEATAGDMLTDPVRCRRVSCIYHVEHVENSGAGGHLRRQPGARLLLIMRWESGHAECFPIFSVTLSKALRTARAGGDCRRPNPQLVAVCFACCKQKSVRRRTENAHT